MDLSKDTILLHPPLHYPLHFYRRIRMDRLSTRTFQSLLHGVAFAHHHTHVLDIRRKQLALHTSAYCLV